MDKAFHKLKETLLEVPALALSDIHKLFHMKIDKNKGIAKGVLTQALGLWKRPVVCLSKRLDPFSKEWPAWLKIVVATALLVKDEDKISTGQELIITPSHDIEGILKNSPDFWISSAHLVHYQPLFLNLPYIRYHPASALTSATLLLNQTWMS